MSDTSSTTSNKPYSCDICDKLYSKPSLLAQHIRSHNNERPFKCEVEGCDKSFLRKYHLQAHSLSHEKESHKPFVCSVCGKGVNTRQHLKRHEITHTKSFQCTEPGCNESFYKHQSLRHHILSVHEKTLTCKICNKPFNRPYRLAQHNLKYHSETPVYQCDTHGCFANFKTWSALQFHIKTEHPKLICPECGKGCVGKKGLKSHMMIHDDEKMVKLWNCTYCDVGQFTRKIELVEHYNTFHDGNMPEDLLKAKEKEQLEKLLHEKEGDNMSNLVLIPSDDDDDDDDDDDEGDFTGTRELDDTKSLESLNSTLRSGRSSIIDMILTNFQKKKIPCPKKNCHRKFAKDYDLQRHLAWHSSHMEKIESFLESLEEEEGKKKRRIVDLADFASKRSHLADEDGPTDETHNVYDVDEYDDGDNDFNSLIDEEIKRITSQGQSQDGEIGEGENGESIM